MNFHVIIPARLKSTRLPNKPLADIHGIPMIVHVAKQAAKSNAQSITVAADHPDIIQACEAHGIHAVLTDPTHPSGSDRLAQACELLHLAPHELVVNVQGDEPLMPVELINACAKELADHPDCAISTAAHPIHQNSEYNNPNVVKVVCNVQGKALYFSRAPIPWWRDGNLSLAAGQPPQQANQNIAQLSPMRHIGIYAYRVQFLKCFPTLAVSPLEKLESLEQLRALWHGENIAVHITNEQPAPGVDTPQDLERIRQILAKNT